MLTNHENKKATFIVEAGTQYGLGHLKRMEVLAQELLDRGWYVVIFITDKFLAQKNIRPFQKVYLWSGNSSDIPPSSIVIIDGYHFSLSIYEKLQQRSDFIIAMDDLGNRFLPVDCVINHNIYGDRIDYTEKGAKHILAGSKYGLVAKKFRSEENSLTRLNSNILVSFGGTDDGKFSAPLVSSLLGKTNNYTVHVVCSPLLIPNEKLTLLEKESDQVVLHHGAEMSSLMKSCKYFIGSAGYSLMEALVADMKVYVCAIADNQRMNAEEYKLKSGRSLDCYDTDAIVEMFLTDVELDYEIKVDCFDGLGASRIVSFLEKELGS